MTETKNNELVRRLSVKEVARVLGISKTSVWEFARKKPNFPKPRKYSPRTTRWRKDEVLTWLYETENPGRKKATSLIEIDLKI